MAISSTKIPDHIRQSLQERMKNHMERKWKGYRIEIRFRGAYAYFDVYPVGKNTLPIHLCRIEYLGKTAAWGFSFYKYSDNRYERAVLPSGSFTGTPEEAFECAASVYLQE
jgi:hypothetical protein